MVRILISLPLIAAGIFFLPFMGFGVVFLIPGIILLVSGFRANSRARSKSAMTEAILDAERIKAESKRQASS